MEKLNTDIFRTLFVRRKHIIIITFAALIIGYVVTLPFFIKPIYRSTAFIYPANIGLYSEESLTEQMMQFLQSNDIRLYLYKKHNLAKHYKIDTLKKTHMFAYDEIYDKRVSISVTKYESAEIRVEDFNPDTATLLVNGIIEAVNTLIENEHRQKYSEDVRNTKILFDIKQSKLDSTQKILDELCDKYGITGIQLQDLARSNYGKETNGGAKTIDLMQNLGKHGVEFIKMSTYLEHQMKDYVKAETDYQNNLSNLCSKKTFTALASKPTYPVVACWPKRSLIMAVLGLSAFVLACIYFVFIGRIKSAYAQIAASSYKKE